ncbi:MAG: flippase-like domain-containing protein [Dehalococcoidia bacterium]|nr:flippase-like domain-containing protein [Dehalococcoidia bacterium]
MDDACSDPAGDEDAALLSRRRFLLGLAASLVFLAIFVLRTDIDGAWEDLKRADYVYVIPAVGVFFVSVWFRAWRWGTVLRPFLVIPTYRLYPYVIIGSMANNILPARAGELVRTYVLGQRYGVKKMVVLGTVAIDRLFDGIALLAIYVVVALISDTNTLLTYIAVAGAAAFGLITAVFFTAVYRPQLAERLLVSLSRWLPRRLQDTALAASRSFLVGLEPLRRPEIIVGVLALSLAAWLGETTMYYILGLGFNLDQPFEVYLLVAAAANLVIALPPSQGGIGPFELVTREVLVLAGVGASVASAYAVALHAALLLPVIVLGLVFLWLVQLDIRRVLKGDDDGSLLADAGRPT